MSTIIKVKFSKPTFLGPECFCSEYCCVPVGMVDEYDNFNPIGSYPVDEWRGEITGNLYKMGSAVKIANPITGMTCTVADVVWEPQNILNAMELITDNMIELLRRSLIGLLEEEETCRMYEPENGWGTYVSFMDFLHCYFKVCLNNHNCLIEIV